jgi:predicted DNA-binding transcriptional regulator AlpA
MESGTLVDAGRCAAALGMSKAAVYKMCRVGKLPAYSAGAKGRGLRFDIQECRAALRRQAVQYQEEVRQ